MAPLLVRFAPTPRLITLVSAVAVTAAGLIALPAQSAAAVSRSLPGLLSAFTDSAKPRKSFPVSAGTAAPLGAWLDGDGDKHVSRGYYTFDLTPLAGRQITEATLSLRETAVLDCARTRSIEVWRVTATEAAPTWKSAPAPLARVGSLVSATAGECPSRYLFVDVAAVLRAAQAEDAAAVTLMVRVAADQEGRPGAGRRIADVGLQTEDNRPPATPTQPSVSGIACTPAGIFVGTRTPDLRVQIDDPDFPADTVTATVAYWPVDRPAERTELVRENVTSAQQLRVAIGAELTDNQTYAFAARTTDRAGATSAWSTECPFTVDVTPPGAPTVASADYPGAAAGGPGIPGTFTLTAAAGDPDVTRFRWGTTSPINEVAAGADGTATIEFTPTDYGRQTLYVQAYDRTRNGSAVTTYTFQVAKTLPIVTDGNPDGAIFAERKLTLAPGMPDVVEYTWWIDEDKKQTVPAGADGTATISVTPDQIGTTYVHITSRTAAGLPSGRLDYPIYVRTAPRVTSPDFPADGSGEPPLVGERVTFQFRPGMPGVTEYVWKINRHEEQVTPAGPDGTATVTWTERDQTYLSLQVTSRTADGLESEPNFYDFSLTSHAPTIESPDYPEWSTSGGPGIAGTFTLRPAREGVTAYTWRLDDGTEQTIPASADGTATLKWTPSPDQVGWHTLQVREVLTTTTSNPMSYEFGVAEPAG